MRAFYGAQSGLWKGSPFVLSFVNDLVYQKKKKKKRQHKFELKTGNVDSKSKFPLRLVERELTLYSYFWLINGIIQHVWNISPSVHDTDNCNCPGIIVRDIENKIVVNRKQSEPTTIPRFVLISAIFFGKVAQVADRFFKSIQLFSSIVWRSKLERYIFINLPKVIVSLLRNLDFKNHKP